MADFDLTQTGQQVQDILDGAAMQSDLTAETERAEAAEQSLQGNIDAEKLRAEDAEQANASNIVTINSKIPAAASGSNQLADKAFVNSSIATATATYRGSYNEVADLSLSVDATHTQIAAALAGVIIEADNNDYCFVQVPTSDATPLQIASIERYKFDGTSWTYEYTLNNSGFTADQWAALNSGITSGLVAKLLSLPTNDELIQALATKQNVLVFDNVPTDGSTNPVKSGGIYTAINNEAAARAAAIAAIVALIPEAASTLNQLADKAFVTSSISTATAVFKGTFNEVADLNLTVDATQAQIAAALAGVIIEADNNDYCFVQVPTSDATPLQIARTDRYKYNGTTWAYEYTLNNSGFTAAQWAAINSGITSLLKNKLIDLPTATELTALLAAKQNTLTFDATPTAGSTNPVTSQGIKSAVDAEKLRAEDAEQANASNIVTINSKIPAAASGSNQLADKAFVNSSIATATATYRGSYNEVADLSLSVDATHTQIAAALAGAIVQADNNDYCFVQIPTSDATPLQIASIERYKFDGTSWTYEYTLNNSGFTADQWAALNSGITSGLVAKLLSLPTNDELTQELAAKQNVLTFDSTPTTGSNNPVTSNGIKAAIDTEAARAAAVEQGLQEDYDDLYQLYQTLSGGSFVPVAAADWPVSPLQQNVVYRVANSAIPTAYSDYMYNGTTTILLATFTFPGIDSTPTAGSPNLVTSGGVFTNIGAFDISDYNKSGSTLATYADLTAALAALPSEYQKGGMSVKYVQSSDNKYIQARCMAQNFTTEVTQWQGVDDEPTADSDNLVKSGGVYRELQKRPSGIDTENLYNKDTLIVGYYVDGAGNLSPASGYNATDYIPVEPNTIYKIYTDYYSLENSAFYNGNKEEISLFNEYTTSLFKSITTPANCYYIRCTVLDSQKDRFMVYKGSEYKKYYPYGTLLKLSNIDTPNNIIFVSQDGRGDYTSISAALGATNSLISQNQKTDNTIILINEGVYHEKLDIRDRAVELVGVNRDKCIIYYDDGNYGTGFPINMGAKNFLRNLTIKSVAPADMSQITSGEAYAVHFDVEGQGTAILDNCTLISELNSAFGVGLHANQTLICRNCTFEGIRDIVGSNVVNAGLLIHNQEGANVPNQKAIFDRCNFYSKKWVGITITDVSDDLTVSNMEIEFIHCVCNSSEPTYQNKIDKVWRSQQSSGAMDGSCIVGTIRRGVMSFGNNVSDLNYT